MKKDELLEMLLALKDKMDAQVQRSNELLSMAQELKAQGSPSSEEIDNLTKIYWENERAAEKTLAEFMDLLPPDFDIDNPNMEMLESHLYPLPLKVGLN